MAADLLTDRNLTIADEVGKVAAGLGTTPTAVALAWVRQRPGITSVIIGPRSLDHLDGNLAGFELDLPAEAAGHLDAISDPEISCPSPGWSPDGSPTANAADAAGR